MATAGGRYRYIAAPKRQDITQKDRHVWANKKREEALAIWLATGSIKEASVQTNVPLNTVASWHQSQWWKDRVKQIHQEADDRMDVKLTKAMDKALDGLLDRVQNGEMVYDPRTGKIRQVPAKLRDLNMAFTSIMDKRQLLRRQPTKIIEQTSTAQQLQQLADHFASFVNGKTKGETFDTLVDKIVEGETVEQGEDGVYYVKDTNDGNEGL